MDFNVLSTIDYEGGRQGGGRDYYTRKEDGDKDRGGDSDRGIFSYQTERCFSQAERCLVIRQRGV